MSPEERADEPDTMSIFMIDAVGPFFKGYRRRRYNWSKVPFDNIETPGGGLDGAKMDAIEKDFARFARTVARLGFNAVSVDDVAHLVTHHGYALKTRRRIKQYRRWYRRLFDIAAAEGLAVYLNTDVMFFNDELARALGNNHTAIISFLKGCFRSVFTRYPRIKGIVIRIGECDAPDVRGEFRSRLVIRTPRVARRYLGELLAVCEECGKLLIFRTWTVGAYRIGDLIWNRYTFAHVFSDLRSESLVISLKYGETDFFRYLPLNRHFYRTDHKKIIELQTRREYEGFGEYPSFTGWDYESYRDQLEGAENVIGASIWCQTGGWSPFFNRTYLDESSTWNEINTYVTLRLFKDRLSVEEAIREYCREYMTEDDYPAMRQLLALSDRVVKELLYIDELAERKIFFRRLRMPPLISVFWDHVIVNHSMRKLLRCLVSDGEGKIRQGFAALDKIERMKQLARRLDLPDAGLDFQYDTFEILAAARQYYFGEFNGEIVERITRLRDDYRRRYPDGRYSMLLDFSRFRVPRTSIKMFMEIFLRRQRGYRLIDRVFTVRVLSWIIPFFKLFYRGKVSRFAAQQAMGIDVVFK